MRYIAKTELASTLRRGCSLEQLLPSNIEFDSPIVRFIRLDQQVSGQVAVTLFEILDEGTPDFLDVYEFSALDPDSPYGVSQSFSNAESAIEFSTRHYGASADKFVSAGVIQDEYKDLYHSR